MSFCKRCRISAPAKPGPVLRLLFGIQHFARIGIQVNGRQRSGDDGSVAVDDVCAADGILGINAGGGVIGLRTEMKVGNNAKVKQSRRNNRIYGNKTEQSG